MREDLQLPHSGAGREDTAARCSVGPWIGSEARKMGEILMVCDVLESLVPKFISCFENFSVVF